MFVDTGMLHSGATDSHRAGEHAHNGANHLAGAPLTAGMFGDFAAAEAFHETVTLAHAHHLDTVRTHQQILSGVGQQARHVAFAFTAMENHNAKALRDLRCA